MLAANLSTHCAGGSLVDTYSRVARERPDTERDLFPYQRDGVAFLAARRAGLLLDSMVLGKSAQDQIGAPAADRLPGNRADQLGPGAREVRPAAAEGAGDRLRCGDG
jgi:hypothetical protein